MLITRRRWTLLRRAHAVRLERLLMHEFVSFGTFSTRFRCDCRRTYMLLVLQREGTLMTESVQRSGADGLDRIVTGVSPAFFQPAPADRIVARIRLRILLHHATERAFVH